MANATFMPPLTGTQDGNFTVGITFNVELTDFTADKLSVTSVSGNGITGVTWAVLPDHDMNSATYNVAFQLPEDVKGSLQIDITGMVTREGSSRPEAVVADAVTVAYDNITNVTAEFGDVVYDDGGEIVVPVTFGENVVVPSKTVFPISHVRGDALAGIEYVLLGKGTAYKLVFTVPPDRKGAFRISGNGDVLKTVSAVWDNIVITNTGGNIEVDYDTSVPELKRFDIPADYTPGEKFDVILQLDTPSTVSPAPTGGMFLDHFIFEGADLGTPNLYRKTDGTYPQPPIAADLGTDWTQDKLTTENATIYLLRWDPVVGNPEGIFNLTIRPGAFRGPVA